MNRLPSFQKALASGDFSTDIQSTLKVDMNGAKLLAATARQLGLSSGSVVSAVSAPPSGNADDL
jgi:hypothetical protein